MKKTKTLLPSTESRKVGAERAAQIVQMRYDPLPYLTPELLTAAHAAFRKGYLSQAATIWEDVIGVDDKLVSVVPTRLNGPSRQGFSYVRNEGHEDDPQAEKHENALKYFYDNLVCTDATNRNSRGGVKFLLRRMMQARAFFHSVQEILWRPSPRGITATFIDMPMRFFENTTGRLRFLEADYALHGADMAPDEWLVTSTKDGLMIATAAARMFKIMPLKDWLVYCEKFGMPGLHGETTAKKDSQDWNDFVEMLRNFGNDGTCVTNQGAKINAVDISAKGELVYPGLVDRCDRALSAIWLGGDLGSMSRDVAGATGGVSLQDKVNDQDLVADCELLTETLNEQVDRLVIRWMFNEDPLAWIRVQPPPRKDVKQDIETDRFLLDAGLPMTKGQLAERYGRTLPDGVDADELVEPSKPLYNAGGGAMADPLAGGAPRSLPSPAASSAANALPAAGPDDAALGKLLAAARLQLDEAQQASMQVVASEVEALIAKAKGLSPEQFKAEVDLLAAKIPSLLERMDAAPAAAVLEQVYAGALAIGLDQAKAQEAGA